MFLLAILAGMLISFGCVVNIACGGGPVGALLFSVGLYGVLASGLWLFTGKAGLLATKEIKPLSLVTVFLGNWIGCFAVSALRFVTSRSEALIGFGTAVTQIRIDNGFFWNIVLGIFCGILMYIAVSGFKSCPIIVPFCVSGFILAGFNHSIADSFYLLVSEYELYPMGLLMLLGTTIGNLIGCNLIPLSQRVHRYLGGSRSADEQ